MGGASLVYDDKNILKVPHGLSFHSNLNYEKSAKRNPTFQRNNFSILAKYLRVSKYTAMLSGFSFLKKGKRIKSKFRMVNLCNGGTKDFAELWEIKHLKI